MSHASVASSRATTIAFEMFAALMPLTYSWSRWKDDNQWQSIGHQWLSMAFDDTQFVLNSCAHHAHIIRTSCAHHSHIIRTSFAHHSHIIRTESHSNTSGAPGACGRCSYWRRRRSEAIRSNQGNHLEHVEDVLIGDGGHQKQSEAIRAITWSMWKMFLLETAAITSRFRWIRDTTSQSASVPIAVHALRFGHSESLAGTM